jgi:hypothetical protein
MYDGGSWERRCEVEGVEEVEINKKGGVRVECECAEGESEEWVR